MPMLNIESPDDISECCNDIEEWENAPLNPNPSTVNDIKSYRQYKMISMFVISVIGGFCMGFLLKPMNLGALSLHLSYNGSSVSQIRVVSVSESPFDVTHDILQTATKSGRFVPRNPLNASQHLQDLNFSDIENNTYLVPQKWANKIGYSNTLGESFHQRVQSIEHITPSHMDSELLLKLHNKSIFIMGDSTDFNIHSNLCHCKRNGHFVSGSMIHGKETKCFSGKGKSCLIGMSSCYIERYNLSIHAVDGEYTTHPYGNIPYGRGQKPWCSGSTGLRECLRKKWNSTCNQKFGMRCISEKTCMNRHPDIIVYNNNVWFWFRMNWYGKSDEIDFQSMSWDSILKKDMQNTTQVLEELRDIFPQTKLIVLHTQVGTTTSARVPMRKVLHSNSAIRDIASSPPQDPLMEVDHMAHAGWSRKTVLTNDIHPKLLFNTAVVNRLLNAFPSI